MKHCKSTVYPTGLSRIDRKECVDRRTVPTDVLNQVDLDNPFI